MNTFPLELMVNIMSYLSFSERLKLYNVSRAFRDAFQICIKELNITKEEGKNIDSNSLITLIEANSIDLTLNQKISSKSLKQFCMGRVVGIKTFQPPHIVENRILFRPLDTILRLKLRKINENIKTKQKLYINLNINSSYNILEFIKKNITGGWGKILKTVKINSCHFLRDKSLSLLKNSNIKKLSFFPSNMSVIGFSYLQNIEKLELKITCSPKVTEECLSHLTKLKEIKLSIPSLSREKIKTGNKKFCSPFHSR